MHPKMPPCCIWPNCCVAGIATTRLDLRTPSLCSRLGYLLEALGRPVDGLEVAKGPIRLDASRPKDGAYSARWRVYGNVPLAELFPDGVV